MIFDAKKVNCLPTAYSNYDLHVPRWIELWCCINHNMYWDCYWATLLTRARKHTATFNWTSLSSLIASKSRELMELPNLQGQNIQTSHFPFSVPNYYTRLVAPLPVDARKVALNKLAKLAYFLSMQGEEVLGDVFSVTPPRVCTSSTAPSLPGFNQPARVKSGAVDFVAFLQFIRPYFHPSHAGAWTPSLSYFLATFVTELTRSIAKCLAHQLSSDQISSKTLPVYSRYPLHPTTVRYLGGCLISLVFETLYGKIPVLIQLSISCIKELVTVEPSFGNIVLPFLLSALDPSAVNQAHQAPAALQTLSTCLRCFLYPRPTILPYLTDILRLSLNGLDANDVKKSVSALMLFNSIFSWMPLGSGLKHLSLAYTSSPSSYLSVLAFSSVSPENEMRGAEEIDYLSSLEHLGEYTLEWIQSFVDKIFTMLEAKETKQAGKKESYSLGSFIANSFETVLLASDKAARDVVIDKVVKYLKLYAPVNAAKEWAKIVDALTWICPGNKGFITLI